MPAFETMDLVHTAVYWEATGVDDYNNPTILSNVGIEIPCRWTEGLAETLDAKGNVIAADASVVVDRELAIGSVMWLGKLVDLPDPPTDLKYIKFRKATSDIKGRNTRRTVLLMKYSDTLPTVES